MFDLLQLRPGLRVADVGCGRGELAAELAAAVAPGGLVVGFDLDEEQLAAGRARAGRSLRFEVGDACDLADVRDDSFDRAVCRRLLIHLSRPIEALREMARIVRPGGLVAAIEPDELAARVAAWDSASALDSELPALRAVVHQAIIRGAFEAGAGDRRLGPRLPGLMAEAGFGEPALRLEAAALVHPPGPLEPLLRRLDEAFDAPIERDLFLAAGGDPATWAEWQRREQAASAERRRQLAAGTFRASVPEQLWVCAWRAPGG